MFSSHGNFQRICKNLQIFWPGIKRCSAITLIACYYLQKKKKLPFRSVFKPEQNPLTFQQRAGNTGRNKPIRSPEKGAPGKTEIRSIALCSTVITHTRIFADLCSWDVRGHFAQLVSWFTDTGDYMAKRRSSLSRQHSRTEPLECLSTGEALGASVFALLPTRLVLHHRRASRLYRTHDFLGSNHLSSRNNIINPRNKPRSCWGFHLRNNTVKINFWLEKSGLLIFFFKCHGKRQTAWTQLCRTWESRGRGKEIIPLQMVWPPGWGWQPGKL